MGHILPEILHSFVVIELSFRSKFLVQQEVQPVVYCTESVDEYVAEGVEAGFTILCQFFPWELRKCVKVSMSHFLVVLNEFPHINHSLHRMRIAHDPMHERAYSVFSFAVKHLELVKRMVSSVDSDSYHPQKDRHQSA